MTIEFGVSWFSKAGQTLGTDETPRLKDPITAYARLRVVVRRLTNEMMSRYQPDTTRLATFLGLYSCYSSYVGYHLHQQPATLLSIIDSPSVILKKILARLL